MKPSKNIQHFKFFGDTPPGTGNASFVEHITPDGGLSVLCGKTTRGKAWDDANWEALHSPRFHRQCPLCRSRAILALRPASLPPAVTGPPCPLVLGLPEDRRLRHGPPSRPPLPGHPHPRPIGRTRRRKPPAGQVHHPRTRQGRPP